MHAFRLSTRYGLDYYSYSRIFHTKGITRVNSLNILELQSYRNNIHVLAQNVDDEAVQALFALATLVLYVHRLRAKLLQAVLAMA